MSILDTVKQYVWPTKSRVAETPDTDPRDDTNQFFDVEKYQQDIRGDVNQQPYSIEVTAWMGNESFTTTTNWFDICPQTYKPDEVHITIEKPEANQHKLHHNWTDYLEIKTCDPHVNTPTRLEPINDNNHITGEHRYHWSGSQMHTTYTFYGELDAQT